MRVCDTTIGHEELRAMQPCSTPEICVMLLAAIALLNCTLRQECSQAQSEAELCAPQLLKQQIIPLELHETTRGGC